MRTILNLSIALLVLCALVTVGCGDGSDASVSGAEVTVTASTTQIADLARNVAGDRAEVTGLLSANSDPHEYEPVPSDAEALIETDLMIESGGDLDVWVEQLVESSGSEAPRLVLLDEVATIEGDHDHEEGEEHAEEEGEEVDPHWWQDPRNAIRAVEAIRDELTAIDPAGRDEYEANADAYMERLEGLDRAIEQCVSSVPEEQRKLVTSHDALGYFADRYGIEVVGAVIPALTTQAQASAGETAELVDLVRETGVEAIFPEAGISPDLEEAIAEEAGAEVGGELWSDTLGPEDSGADTYVSATAANAESMVAGFTGGEQTCSINVE